MLCRVKKYLLILFTVLLTGNAFAQSQTDTLFIKTIGGIAEDVGYDATVCSDNTVLVCGSTSSFGVGATDVYLIKTDSLGELIWSKTFGYENVEIAKEVIEIANKDIVLTGYTNSNGANGYDILLMKLDSLGETKWVKQFGGTDWEFGNSLCNKNNNGVIVAGEKYGSFGDKDIYYFATNSDGNIIWEKTISVDGEDHAARLKQTLDGNFVLAGNITTTNDSSQAHLIKFKENGDTLWTKTFGYSGNEYIHDITTTNDSGFVLVGSTNSTLEFDLDYWVVKVDKNGEFLWDKIMRNSTTPGVINRDDEATTISESNQGLLFVGGYTKTWGNSIEKDVQLDILTYDGWEFNGNTATFGTLKSDETISINYYDNGNAIGMGVTNGAGNGLYDIILFVIDSINPIDPYIFSKVSDNPILKDEELMDKKTVYSETILLSSIQDAIKSKSISVVNILGQAVTENISTGIYILSYPDHKGYLRKKTLLINDL